MCDARHAYRTSSEPTLTQAIILHNRQQGVGRFEPLALYAPRDAAISGVVAATVDIAQTPTERYSS